METQRLRDKLIMRDQQIKDMESQILDFKSKIDAKSSLMYQLEQQSETLDTKIKRKEEQLESELQEKEELLKTLEELEEQFESRANAKNPKGMRTKSEDSMNVTSAYIEFYQSMQKEQSARKER
ncbi:unnamed protein product [Blepharisma stoltei]|uniref:Uncharacterized protein n=1 Tax=Blepharisma stoltei TaxID=1481888 RepID=A0AAU9JAP9_9CILI|nr:unnamed protein product [Blepharisma stoltei]